MENDDILVSIKTEEISAQSDNEVTQDNRDIQDDTTSQKLSRDDIISLRQEGVVGETIIQEIVENSATFKDRAEYSKAKYIKKKKKKLKMRLIEDGKGVILKKGNNLKYVCVSEHKTEKMENFFFSCKDMIGKPFGTAFKVIDKKRLQVVDPVTVQEHAEEYEMERLLEKLENDGILVSIKTEEISAQRDNEVTQDNRDIQDDTTSQKLSRDDIMSLRQEGVEGETIIQEIVENSATFKDRTEYSKAKYIKKKKKKYLAQFIALQPTTRLLAEMYFFKNPNKILEIRPDSLAQMLSISNVQSGSNVLLLENCQGLLLGAVMKRLGTSGKILQFYQGSYPVRIITEQYNFSFSDIENLVCSFPLEKLAMLESLLNESLSDEKRIELVLGKPKEEILEAKRNEGDDAGDDRTSNDEIISIESDTNEVEICESDKDDQNKYKNLEGKSVVKKRKLAGTLTNDRRIVHNNSRVAFINRVQRTNECKIALNYLRKCNFTSLLMATKYHPKVLLTHMLKYLSPGCPFAVYFAYQEPLMECYVTLRELNLATNVEITETWCRNIQVLPNRTHPEIVMSSTGGYILKGIKVVN